MTPPKHLRIGVFIPKEAQLLDLSPIDLFGMLDPVYLSACRLPAPLVSLGTPSTIHYISIPSSGADVQLTAGAIIRVTKTIEDVEVQPGTLDVLLVPGPNPEEVFDEEVKAFVRGHAAWMGTARERTDVLSVCTGCIILAQAGVLKGRTASGPRAILPKFRKQFPETEWVGDKRWVRDGNIWSSGGITNGQEMVAAYLREKFAGPATEAVLAMADVGEKGVYYSSGKTRENAWWLWQILKSVVLSIGKEKKV